ncbi:3',5'-cyclic AMP phosphodiesterase CpdA [Amycolatopsis bartoniae]|uniref:Uncharacterized protein n=1 Tax=Amycolatopsis bartoniae TaxID=941986 RepID=A0A8H9M8S1_9PSEU|nr:hypothetical protein [Amycolatopsis bartoniae]MBB2934021.1 3',5'-cyclic AMP phosphodiesterase CpdA [Amycolatopsis bartoniae]TVT07317.1 hypothetical protein FNH07_16360 [Amycolatopsis bartoniae]GHF85843.1 hypothetical protein GCM10017566_69650 [Amycolatopsis bartoniae]
MSDTRMYYGQLRGRARQLVKRLDEAMHGLMAVETAIEDVVRADMDNPGELSTTDRGDLRQFLETAQFSVRAAERIANEHVNDVERAMRRLGMDPEKIVVPVNSNVWNGGGQ